MKLIEKHSSEDINKFLFKIRFIRNSYAKYLKVNLENVIASLLIDDLSSWGVWILDEYISSYVSFGMIPLAVSLVKNAGYYKDMDVYLLDFENLTVTPITWEKLEALYEKENKGE